MDDIIFKARVLRVLLQGAYKEWRDTVWKRDLDGQYCCDGRECCCGGETLRDMWKWHLPDDQREPATLHPGTPS